MQVPVVGHPVVGSAMPGQVVSFTPQTAGQTFAQVSEAIFGRQVFAYSQPVIGSFRPGHHMSSGPQVTGQTPGHSPTFGMQVPAVGHDPVVTTVPGQVVSFTPQTIGQTFAQVSEAIFGRQVFG